MLKYLEWIGTLSSLIGAYLVATKFYRTGYIFFAVGATIWILSAAKDKNWALLAQNLGFFGSNVIGLFLAFS